MWKALAAAAAVNFLSTSDSPFPTSFGRAWNWVESRWLVLVYFKFRTLFMTFFGGEGLLALYLLAIFGEESLSQAEPGINHDFEIG